MVEEDGPDEPGDDVETAFEEVCKILFMAVVFIRHCIFLSQSNILFIPSLLCPTVTYIYIPSPVASENEDQQSHDVSATKDDKTKSMVSHTHTHTRTHARTHAHIFVYQINVSSLF